MRIIIGPEAERKLLLSSRITRPNEAGIFKKGRSYIVFIYTEKHYFDVGEYPTMSECFSFIKRNYFN